MSAIMRRGDNIVLTLYIQPKASRDAIVGIYDGALKIAITAPPVDGKANAHLQKYLAGCFGVAKSRVILEKGASGRRKQVTIINPPQIPPELALLQGSASENGC